ncbi:hypothetical protein R1flu_005629 [Riccia fluitans]|uniref:Uncharacterized protein n=1 Tax=Riccia fluitans TaxID=41844 RepID=A0ABD1YUJ0_9MARC
MTSDDCNLKERRYIGGVERGSEETFHRRGFPRLLHLVLPLAPTTLLVLLVAEVDETCRTSENASELVSERAQPEHRLQRSCLVGQSIVGRASNCFLHGMNLI